MWPIDIGTGGIPGIMGIGTKLGGGRIPADEVVGCVFGVGVELVLGPSSSKTFTAARICSTVL